MESDTAIQVLKAFNNVWEFLNEIHNILTKSKKGGLKLLGSKKSEIIERKFKEALEGAKNAIEYYIWYGKGFAIKAECGVEVDKEFHFLMGFLTKIFNDISLKLIPEKLNDGLVIHLQGQLKILEDYAQHFWQIQGINSYPDKENRAIAIIENFRQRLYDFETSMRPYLKSDEK